MLKREDSKSAVSPQMQITAVLPPTFLPFHSFSIFSTFLKDSEAELAAVKIRILSLHQMCPYLIMCSHGNKSQVNKECNLLVRLALLMFSFSNNTDGSQWTLLLPPIAYV